MTGHQNPSWASCEPRESSESSPAELPQGGGSLYCQATTGGPSCRCRAMMRGHPCSCQAVGWEQTVLSGLSGEDSAVCLKVPHSPLLDRCLWIFMTKHTLSQQPGLVSFQFGPRGAEKDAQAVVGLLPRIFFRLQGSVSSEEWPGPMLATSFCARPGSPKPSFWCCYLLLQNVELFKRHSISFVAIQLP